MRSPWQKLHQFTQFLYTTKEQAALFDTKRLLGLKKIRITAYTMDDTDCIIDMAKAGVVKVELCEDKQKRESYYTIHLK
ncbi:MAG: hypothetical protein [Bacteriophage sp.]|nr:MAG: hypothetical protein [Bacteriophage sp.]